ncbi:PilZ domain-containing protein [Tepidiforma sp.]|uniref:PilZ domain-containing protein n=1 Tax=Tepidiforma sp. TaxID=2682230 RepID=UPI002ADD69A7|nr:PilZ domain-containing protein [Tepidiforma sp.]
MKPNEHGGGRRRAPRFPADLPYRLYVGDGLAAEGRLNDLSMTGAAFSSPLPVTAPTAVLRLLDPAGQWQLDLPVTILACHPDPLGGHFIRVKFHLDLETARPLAYVVTHLRQQFARSQARVAADRVGPYRRAHLKRQP